MKKLLLFVCCCMAFVSAWADEQKKVSLSGDHTQELIGLGYCNLTVTLVNPESGEDEAKVLIEVENLDETNTLMLFDRAYEEKSLKDLGKPIKFDKTFVGTKGKRVIDPYNGQMRSVMMLTPSADKYSLPTLTAKPDETLTARLPIYFAKEKKEGFFIFKSKKIVLLEKQVIELKIDAELKPSQEYLGLKAKIDDLQKELNRTTFCNNSKHRPALNKQIEAFQKKTDELKAQIDAAVTQHGWTPDAGGYQRYQQLKDDIDQNLNPQNRVRDCGRHNTPTHQCAYCNWSLSRIYQEMDKAYRTIYNSSDRQATKASLMSKVKAMYQCCTDAGCTKHASAWNRGGNDKSQIVRCYNRIQGL